jgi:RNase adaptor protein for sRNA GlmZ degradation
VLISFGHKHGVPDRVQKVFDVRDLTHNTKSPKFQERLAEIRRYISDNPGHNVAVGCEQGQHRSVILVNQLARALKVSHRHRDTT